MLLEKIAEDLRLRKQAVDPSKQTEHYLINRDVDFERHDVGRALLYDDGLIQETISTHLFKDCFVAANRRADVDKALADVDFDKNTYQVEFDTTMGKILLDVYPDVAPGHAKNLIGLTKIGFYDGIIFHRVISDFVIQVGCPEGTGTGGPGYRIPAEFSKTQHEPGILSMARTSDPNSAGSQFFICLSRRGTASLDNQYTVFGKTADQASLDVVLKIGDVETNSSDRPKKDVKINKGRVIVTPKKA